MHTPSQWSVSIFSLLLLLFLILCYAVLCIHILSIHRIVCMMYSFFHLIWFTFTKIICALFFRQHTEKMFFFYWSLKSENKMWMHRYWEKKRDKSKLMMKNDQRNRGKKENRTKRMSMRETSTKRIEMANEKDKRSAMGCFSNVEWTRGNFEQSEWQRKCTMLWKCWIMFGMQLESISQP